MTTTQADVLPDLQEQVDGGVPVGAVRGGPLQRHAVDLLRAAQVQRAPAHHHQLRRLRHRDPLHRHVPPLRAQEGKGPCRRRRRASVVLTMHAHPSLTHARVRIYMQLFTAKILLFLNVGVFGLILLLTLLLSAGQRRVVVLGWVCVAFSVSVFVAPLSIIVRTTQHHA
jgi:hypothetical protein